MWRKFIALASVTAVATAAAPALGADDAARDAVAAEPARSQFSAPVRIEAEGGPIDVDIGHAAPFVADFDGDDTPDLLVGQFGDGKLRIYRNEGTAREPLFKTFTWFKAGADLGKVPAS
jgi:hypothetical protein